MPKAKPEVFCKCLKCSKECTAHWLKCLTCYKSSMVLLSDVMQVVALGIKNWVSKL